MQKFARNFQYHKARTTLINTIKSQVNLNETHDSQWSLRVR
jgi:hypothetical protein